MTSRPASASRKPVQHRPDKKSAPKSGPAKLPEWNLADLYSGIDAPEVTRDLAKLDAECVAFEADYKGKLAEHTAKEGGKWLFVAARPGLPTPGETGPQHPGAKPSMPAK